MYPGSELCTIAGRKYTHPLGTSKSLNPHKQFIHQPDFLYQKVFNVKINQFDLDLYLD